VTVNTGASLRIGVSYPVAYPFSFTASLRCLSKLLFAYMYILL